MKLIFCDLDKTVLPDGGIVLSKQIEKGFLLLEQAGYTIVLTSARIAGGIFPIAKQIAMDQYGGYVIACNGSCIYDMKTNEMIHGVPIAMEEIDSLYSYIRKTDLNVSCEQKDFVVLSGVDVGVKQDVENCQIAYVINENYKEELRLPVYKCSVTGEKDLLDQHFHALQELLKKHLSVHRSTENFVDIIDVSCNKLSSMKWLIDAMHCKKEECIAIGDGNNDRDMIAYAGLGVTLENGSESCKAVADLIVPDCRQEGFLTLVEKLIGGTIL